MPELSLPAGHVFNPPPRTVVSPTLVERQNIIWGSYQAPSAPVDITSSSHFLAVPLGNNTEIAERTKKFRSKLLKDKTIVVGPPRLHFTVEIVRLEDEPSWRKSCT
ncbi:hypothetical protein FRC06_005965 [Ceratobasidium sp. 370]|nr:hypothetical protein FRC06_005965 [Ceratobasidium sp. 370]